MFVSERSRIRSSFTRRHERLRALLEDVDVAVAIAVVVVVP